MVLSIDRWVGKVAVVTGASSGIGYAISVALVQNGLKVVGLARRLERLHDLETKLEGSKGTFIPKSCDITDESQVINTFRWIEEVVGPVHALINNAGVSPAGTIVNGDYSTWKVLFDTNVMGLLTATREAIRQMKTANIAGHIININSILGHSVSTMPEISVYSATKFGVTAITEILRIELREETSKIKVTSLSPGLVETDMNEGTTEEQEKFLADTTFLKPEDIADGVLYLLSTPEHVQVHELTIKPVGEKI